MRFPVKFSRTGGGGTLGTDAVPTTAPNPTTADNLLLASVAGINGWPVYRVAVTYAGPVTAGPMQGTMYFWEETTGAWYQIGASQMLQKNCVTFFDVVALTTPAQSSSINYSAPGGLEIVLVVADTIGSAPAGTYTFAMGADVTADGQNFQSAVGLLPSIHSSAAAGAGTAGVVIKAAPGRVLHVTATNKSATAYTVMFFDKATAPVNADVPVYRRKLLASGEIQPEDFGQNPFPFKTGISWALSTTNDVLTLAAALDGFITVLYE